MKMIVENNIDVYVCNVNKSVPTEYIEDIGQ